MTSNNNFMTGWTLAKPKSIFHNKKMQEIAPYNQVLGFLQGNLGVSYVGQRRYNHLVEMGIHNEKIQIEKYKNIFDREKRAFQTSQNLAKHGWGRCQPKDHLSLSVIHRPTRHTLAQEAYMDIDMCCAHPQILVEICRLNNVAGMVPAIAEYVANSKRYRHELMEMHGVSYDVAKQLPLRLMFGGDYNAWKKDFGVEDTVQLELMKDYQTQITAVSEIVHANNPKIVKDVLKATPEKWTNDFAKKRGVMSLWCLTLERLIQEAAISHLVENQGFILEDIVPCQDGFMVKKQLWYEGIVADCEAAVTSAFGIVMPFINKPFDEAIEIPIATHIKPIEEWEDCITVKPLSKKFIQVFGDFLLRDPESGGIYIFHNGRWFDESDAKSRRHLLTYISERLFEIVAEEIRADTGLKTKEINYLLKNLRNNTSSAARMNEIITHTISVCNPMVEPFDSKPFLLGFNDGVYDLEIGEFRAYQYNDYMTMSTNYDFPHLDLGDLSEEDAEMRDTLVKMFDEIQPNHEDMLLQMQVLASGLDGLGYQKLALYNGQGGNGKGLVGMFMDSVLGDYYCQPGNGLLRDCEKANAASPDMLGLRNKRYINFKEVDGMLKTSVLRNLTGGGRYVGRKLYGNPVSFKMMGTFVLEFNSHPDLDGKPQEADYRRMLDMQFPTNFTTDMEKVGKNVGGCEYKLANTYYITEDFIKKARPIFFHMLALTYRTYKRNDGTGIKFDVPQATMARTSKFLANQNVFAMVFKKTWDVCEVLKSEDGKLDANDLKRKTFTVKKLWDGIQKDDNYRFLPGRDKRNQYGRDAFYVWLDQNYPITYDRHGTKIVVGLEEIDNDDDGEEDGKCLLN